MSLEKVGLNFTNWGNITAPVFDIPTTQEDWVQKSIDKANELTYGYYGIIVLLALFMYLVQWLTDTTYAGEMRYSKIRGVGIAAAICGIMGSYMLLLGFFTHAYHVVLFIVLMFISLIWCWIDKRQ
jgi:hypothetical protein